ncbi:hypothetical protein ACFL4T_07435 [candidate division KSB1 bacterium]
MKVRGEALISLPVFIITKFGKTQFVDWLDSLTPEAKKVYNEPVDKSEWYPLKQMLIEPTQKLCEMFYNNDLRGAFECGKYSAEYGLKGIYKVLVKLSSPEILINRATKIIQNYYEPSEVEVMELGLSKIIVRITEFSEMEHCIEQRIAGWMARAIEITGKKLVRVKVTKSLVQNDPFSEFEISWLS